MIPGARTRITISNIRMMITEHSTTIIEQIPVFFQIKYFIKIKRNKTILFILYMALYDIIVDIKGEFVFNSDK